MSYSSITILWANNKCMELGSFFIYFICKLHTHTVSFESATSPFIPLLWKEDVSFELELIGNMMAQP